jgi:RNA polymerase sigma-70 factor (sigma-E family)
MGESVGAGTRAVETTFAGANRLGRCEDQVRPMTRPEILDREQEAEIGIPETVLPHVAIATLHAHHYLPMVRLAVALVDDEPTAEDVVQDAFVGLLRSWRRLRDPGAAEFYLRRSVVNGCRDRLRHRRVRRTTVLPHPADARSAEDAALDLADHRDVVTALTTLPTRQREVLVLRYFAELSEAEIAHTLDISTGAVKSTAHKAIAALRRALAEEDS